MKAEKGKENETEGCCKTLTKIRKKRRRLSLNLQRKSCVCSTFSVSFQENRTNVGKSVSEKGSSPRKSGTDCMVGARATKFITSSWVTAGFSGNTKEKASRTPVSTPTESKLMKWTLSQFAVALKLIKVTFAFSC